MSDTIVIAVEGLAKEQEYLRAMGEAQASVSESMVGMPAQFASWGPWGDLHDQIVGALDDLNRTVSTARPAFEQVAELVAATARAYQQTEDANTVRKES